ncbi:uncharacterized protein EV422DRAFT_190700 [Fimicolochytrium jonesii]|uniref:uncharacterized protein n=1 Tax=Fimicolochytrium jonesii TaxID=1396493 RepID=UPI0022FEAB65|nr:uncharacterized protein EV422DRAFT_190700 [Fimicolochytrium jonesii]KAI8818137.1 hypothetical protein EV422DRAFT_190700 [Fimicolochytrium jonesii]
MARELLDTPLQAYKRKRADVAGPSCAASRAAATVKKRVKTSTRPSTQFLLPSGKHPRGIKPAGNYLFDSARGVRDCRKGGLGYLAYLPDELLLDLLGQLEAADLSRLARCSQALYVFTYHDDLWRALTINEFGTGGWGVFQNTWRNTYKYRNCVDAGRPAAYLPDVPIVVEGIYSDFLFTSFRCASVPLDALCGASIDNIERRSNLSYREFVVEYAKPNKPVILTDVVSQWPAYEKWSEDYLLEHYGNKMFTAEAVRIPFRDYLSYSQNCTQDEAPLYLFDKRFAEGTSLSEDYTVPEYFKEDFFGVLGEQRPDYRWLIIGPARSGSTFHVDPNSTSAWNAVISGAKKWIMYPPEVIPPGVFPSPDGSEVTAPLSLPEWFLSFYEQTKSGPSAPIEGVCRAGEILFVPRGWWHAVMNLEPSIALTQNFVSSENLREVLQFLRCRREQVSGFCDGESLYEKFTEAFEAAHPGVIADLMKKADMRDAPKASTDEIPKPSSLWSIMNELEGESAPLFSFGGDD